MKLGHNEFVAVCFVVGLLGLGMGALHASSSATVGPWSSAQSCASECVCELDVTVLSATLPPCVNLIDLQLENNEDGCCFITGDCLNPFNCEAKVTVIIQGTAGTSCRKRIESSQGTAAQGNGDIQLEEQFNKECGEDTVYTLFTGNPFVEFAQYRVDCYNCI